MMEKKWWEGAHRVLLLNLREGDEPKVDAQQVVEQAQRYAATAFCINGGGIVAFYQTNIPGHRVSRALGKRDLLAEIIPVAHAAGLRVLARVDPSCAPRQWADTHPEWFARDAEGRLCEVSGHYVTCPNADYYHVRMVEVVTEILTRYDADGIWNNQGKFAAWDTGTCYCGTCRSLFCAQTGEDIPRKEDWSDPVWRQYNEWRYQCIAAWVKRMHEAVHAAKPNAVFIAAVQLIESLETIRPGGWDIDYWVPYQDVLTFECQRRNTAPWWPGIQAKYLATLAPDKPRWMTVSYFYPWWRLYAAPEQENRPWIAQQFANGVSSWLHINGGYSSRFDRRGLAPMQAVFQRLARWSEYFEGAVSDARVAVIFSRYTQDNYGGDRPHARYLDAVRGYYCALQEAHVPFDVVSDKILDAARLARYRVLVLPNAACLTDAAIDAIEAFVKAGGSIVATFDTGRFDEHGEPRSKPAFASLFGGEYIGRREDLRSSYANVENRADPLLAGLGDTDLIPNDGALIEFKVTSTRAVPLTLIPPVQTRSGATISIPEYSAISATTDVPIVVHGEHGSARVVFFCNQMDALFYRYGFADLGKVLANAVHYALGDARTIEVDAPDFVEVSVMRQGTRYLVHLINLPVDKPLNTGWRHPGRNLVTVTGIGMRMKIAAEHTVKAVRLATTGAPLAYTREGEWMALVVPRLADHEIVVIEST